MTAGEVQLGIRSSKNRKENALFLSPHSISLLLFSFPLPLK